MVEDSLVEKQLEAWGLSLSERQLQDLRRFGHMLYSYSEANVIGAKTFSAVIEDHILDSLSCLLFQGFDSCRSLVDVGAGAGLPGIPLRIARPDIVLTLLESTIKKAKFIGESITELGFTEAIVVNERAEEIGRRKPYRDSHDIATARALAPLSVVAEYCVPLVRAGGSVVAMKGRLSPEELEAGERAARELGARVSRVLNVPLLPEMRAKDRRLVIIEKVSDTPKKYPRRTGIPRKQPLGDRMRQN